MTFKEYFTEDNKLNALKSFVSLKVKPLEYNNGENDMIPDHDCVVNVRVGEIIGDIECSYNDLVRNLNKPHFFPLSFYDDYKHCYWFVTDDKGVKANISGVKYITPTIGVAHPNEPQYWTVRLMKGPVYNDTVRKKYFIKALENTVNGHFTDEF